jgi:hypothetical protein
MIAVGLVKVGSFDHPVLLGIILITVLFPAAMVALHLIGILLGDYVPQ